MHKITIFLLLSSLSLFSNAQQSLNQNLNTLEKHLDKKRDELDDVLSDRGINDFTRNSDDRFNNDRYNKYNERRYNEFDDRRYNDYDDERYYRYDSFRDKSHRPWDLRNRRRRPIQSFQSRSYVHDDIPFLVMQQENLQRVQVNQKLAAMKNPFKQTATVTEIPNILAKKYIDKNDDYLGLTKNEERIKIFYQNNPSLAPLDLRKPGDSYKNPNSYTKKLFNSFKTQRAGDIVGKNFHENDEDYDEYYQNQYYQQQQST